MKRANGGQCFGKERSIGQRARLGDDGGPHFQRFHQFFRVVESLRDGQTPAKLLGARAGGLAAWRLAGFGQGFDIGTVIEGRQSVRGIDRP